MRSSRCCQRRPPSIQCTDYSLRQLYVIGDMPSHQMHQSLPVLMSSHLLAFLEVEVASLGMASVLVVLHMPRNSIRLRLFGNLVRRLRKPLVSCSNVGGLGNMRRNLLRHFLMNLLPHYMNIPLMSWTLVVVQVLSSTARAGNLKRRCLRSSSENTQG
jgi:hypothetical protein